MACWMYVANFMLKNKCWLLRVVSSVTTSTLILSVMLTNTRYYSAYFTNKSALKLHDYTIRRAGGADDANDEKNLSFQISQWEQWSGLHLRGKKSNQKTETVQLWELLHHSQRWKMTILNIIQRKNKILKCRKWKDNK